jgi:hypothetical protein
MTPRMRTSFFELPAGKAFNDATATLMWHFQGRMHLTGITLVIV